MRFIQTTESSTISQVYYDAITSELFVQFKATEAVYIYSNVSATDVVAILFAESQGAEFAKRIRSSPAAHPYRKF